MPLLADGGKFIVRRRTIQLVYGVLLVGTLIEEVVEIALYAGNLLKPSTYLAFAVLKAVGWTAHNWPELYWFCLHWDLPAGVGVLRQIYLVAVGAMPLVCWASLLYAARVFAHNQRQERARAISNMQSDSLGDETLSFVLSNEVNQAAHLTRNTSALVKTLACLDHSIARASETTSVRSRVQLWARICAEYGYASLLSVPFMVFATRIPGEPRSSARYTSPDPVRFHNWDYPRVLMPRRQVYHDEPQDISRLRQDGWLPPVRPTNNVHTLQDRDGSASNISRTLSSGKSTRLLGPRYLCFLSGGSEGYTTAAVSDWTARHPRGGNVGYVFVSYTRRQFYTQIWNDPHRHQVDTKEQKAAIERDRLQLTSIGVQAARAANVSAFWIDFECVQPDDDELADDYMEDVYRICDVVRAAHSLVVVLAPPHGIVREDLALSTDKQNVADWLHDWGRRLWTVPEALLSPSEHRIAVYTVGSEAPELIAKRNFASRAYCDDADAMQQLIDHYESSMPLTPLQFISLALECLQRRQTEKRMAGDVAYALMGLLRQRPKVEKTDSDFQAFARLSLANDSDRLLERLLCLNPQRADAPWHDLNDAWGAKLWDIDPLCQIADVEDKSTITLGSVFGTTINWTRLELVDFEGSTTRKRFTWMYLRMSAGLALWLAFVPIAFAPLWSIYSQQPGPQRDQLSSLATLGIEIVIFACSLALVVALFIPAFLLHLQQGDVYSTQARFFGIEGRPDLHEVERALIGADHAQLSTRSPDGGRQPPSTAACPPELRCFTLIDTFTFTATTFYANEPPAVVMVCGRERGMLRALLCSYDWATQNFKRETTMRLEAVVLERMPRMDRLRLLL